MGPNGSTYERMNANGNEKLSDELRSLAESAGELFNVNIKDQPPATGQIRDRLAETLESAEKTLDMLNRKASEGVKSTDELIRTRPYQAIGVALGVGLLIGLLIKRK
jgi:ElaB/YqjD/DUF883 family membrane-anchored ribosome-binding protein